MQVGAGEAEQMAAAGWEALLRAMGHLGGANLARQLPVYILSEVDLRGFPPRNPILVSLALLRQRVQKQ
jgi:hypothetical protein